MCNRAPKNFSDYSILRGLNIFPRMLAGALLLAALVAAAGNSDVPPTAAVADEELAEIIITAPEPRYVASTRRDRIGRIWAPVYINSKGPFRLVLDTGASISGVTSQVAAALELPL